MPASSGFSLFPQLPVELQLKIWEELTSGLSMHLFDVCYPSERGADRSRRAFESDGRGMDEDDNKRYSRYKDYVFLDCLDAGEEDVNRTTAVARYRFDPSMYRQRLILRATSRSAASTTRLPSDTNTVYLPGRRRRVEYDNRTGVLLLRFRDAGAATGVSQQALLTAMTDLPRASVIGDFLDGSWSAEMAKTLREARRIALDVAETWNTNTRGEILFEEAVYLACCIQDGLEVLYLIDQCPGRCPTCSRRHLTAAGLQARGSLSGSLQQSEDDATREPDVIRGVGKTYREIFDLEGLGWNDCHPTYLFAQVISEAIQSQQDANGGSVFKGVRILVTEDEPVPGVDSRLLMDCGSEATSSCTEPITPRELVEVPVDLPSAV